ncbi:rhamnogalacturonan lyase family protein [Jidongwangia harbinensis]|uniref:rhamnogalacturonan lyase family protein n=1 Tax=Jidongwangia harbinensis TaxID=2878561 RepID=UPI001CDA3BE0|nr:cellulose binding domain-containing protein [Jidongwangia harbinensis]MCA2216657.1 cellulose binding domain-containing protein [Jidongwangia harbinensis]
MFPRSRWRVALLSTTLAAGVAGAGVLTAVAAGAAAAGCRVDYTVTNQWPGGFGAGVTLTNLGDPVDGWSVTWAYDAGQTVTQAWEASVTQSGSQVTARNVGHNAGLATNARVAFGFNGSWAGSNPAPNGFALNGTACTGQAAPPTGEPSPSDPPPSGPPPSEPPTPPSGSGRQLEDLNRGLVSVRSGAGNLLSWRLLGTEPATIGFNVYRGATRVNSAPITNSTNLLDDGAPADASYTVRAVVDGVEQVPSEPSLRFAGGTYLDVPISRPGGSYTAGDASVGDVDGDGQYELFLKWDPADQKDNSQSGTTSNVYLDAYRLDGTRLWRVDLGRNIRAGAHYTQFQVYDYDGDGRAEMAVKTGDGTVSGTGQVIGDRNADHRNSSGYIITGPEYLTMFNGLTGAAMSTVAFEPARGNISDWGDNYGNRGDRFLSGTAYLDGRRPTVVMGRGYYARSAIAAWDFRDGALRLRWKFDSRTAGSQWTGRGTHSLSIADVDRNGTDEIIYGGMTVNANGTGRYATHPHGDALHVSDFVPSRPGQEIWQIHESGGTAATLRDANNGATIFQRANTCGCEGPARGAAGDIHAGSPGGEFWGVGTGLTSLFNGSGGNAGRSPGTANFLAWWDADPVRELLDGNHVDKYGTGGNTRLLTGSGAHSVNGTKATPSLSGDLFGDWREEIILPRDDNAALRIYATPTPTTRRIHTLLHDAQYRVAVAWQNTAYNQPPHPSFFLGDGMTTPPQPNIYLR